MLFGDLQPACQGTPVEVRCVVARDGHEVGALPAASWSKATACDLQVGGVRAVARTHHPPWELDNLVHVGLASFSVIQRSSLSMPSVFATVVTGQVVMAAGTLRKICICSGKQGSQERRPVLAIIRDVIKLLASCLGRLHNRKERYTVGSVIILGLYRDNGKENGSYYIIIGHNSIIPLK